MLVIQCNVSTCVHSARLISPPFNVSVTVPLSSVSLKSIFHFRIRFNVLNSAERCGFLDTTQ